MTVTEYETNFKELSKYALNGIATEWDNALNFQHGLNKEIRAQVAPLTLETLSDVLKTAHVLEEELSKEAGVQQKVQ